MDCDDLAPFFLLYNDGKLNGFGIAERGFLESPRVEHPTQAIFGVRVIATLNFCFLIQRQIKLFKKNFKFPLP